VRAIATANVLVKNGLGVEKFLANIVNNSQNPQLLEIDTSSGIKETPKEQNLRDVNPHIWLDPVLAQQQIINIRDGLIRADPRNKTTYQTNARKYIQELKNLDAEFTNALKQTPNCTFITFHDAFPYLAQRYHLHQLAVVEIPEDQLSPADVEKAVNAVKKYKVKTLFSELGVDNKLLTSLSRDLHLTLHPLNSLENGETNPEYYFKAMRANLQAITAGCNS
jgi:zinc/manganese transport system substrate-binding protein